MRRVAAQCAALVAVAIVAVATLMPTPPPAEAAMARRWAGVRHPICSSPTILPGATTRTGRRPASARRPPTLP